MKLEELMKGQKYYSATIWMKEDGHDYIRLRELTLKTLGKAFVTFEITVGDVKYRVVGKERWHISSHMGDIHSLQLSPAQAVSHLRNRVVHRIEQERERMTRREREFEKQQKLIVDWFNERGL